MERIVRGDIWVVELLAHPKPRPALVISIDAVNDLCPDVLLMPITSHAGPLRVKYQGQVSVSLFSSFQSGFCGTIVLIIFTPSPP